MVNPISRRSTLLGAAGALTLNSCKSSTANEQKPNIVIIVTDDQRADTLGVVGNENIFTPNIDSLARDGHVFENAFVTTSICGTSRASIILGEYASRHGIWTGAESDGSIINRSFMSALKANGYKSFYFGKWGIDNSNPAPHFDAYYGFGNAQQYFEASRGDIHLTDHLGSIAVDQIQRMKDEPFCLVFATKAPHAQDGSEWPFQHDPKFSDLYSDVAFDLQPSISDRAFDKLPDFLKDSEGRKRWQTRFGTPEKAKASRRDYYRLITGIDYQVGRIIGALKAQGLYENALVLFTSDNGMMLGEHGLSGKWWMFEESIKIPMVLKLPSTEKRKPNTKTFALNVDIHPTVLDVCGLSPSDRVQGVSLLGGSQRSSFFYEHRYDHPKIPKSEGVRVGDLKYIRFLTAEHRGEMVFDLKEDPFEMDNLVERAPGLLASLRAQFEQLRSKIVTS